MRAFFHLSKFHPKPIPFLSWASEADADAFMSATSSVALYFDLAIFDVGNERLQLALHSALHLDWFFDRSCQTFLFTCNEEINDLSHEAPMQTCTSPASVVPNISQICRPIQSLQILDYSHDVV